MGRVSRRNLVRRFVDEFRRAIVGGVGDGGKRQDTAYTESRLVRRHIAWGGRGGNDKRSGRGPEQE